MSAPRELEYVFEVDAEEVSTQGMRDSADDEVEFLLDEDDLAPVEDFGDEAFAYEVRPTAGTGRERAEAGKKAPGIKKRSRAPREK